MKGWRLLAIVTLPALGSALAWNVVASAAPPVRWSADGHRMAARAAHAILPSDMPDFFLRSREVLEDLSPEPDRWRSGELRVMDEAWKYDHYIDLENVPPGALGAPDRFEFITELYESGIERPQQTVGFLPFRILELYQRLTTAFAYWRLASGDSDREWIRIRILNDAGVLSHYVVDASQPHHTTIHFNGWAEGSPNPLGFTTDRDFHARFESGFVRAHISFQDLPPLLPAAPSRIGNVREAVWEYIQETNGTVKELYRLEKEHGFDPDRPAHPEARAFAVERLARGAEMLADIWWTAWQDSADLAARMEREGWNH